MSAELRIFRDQQLQFVLEWTGSLEIGRQMPDERLPIGIDDRSGRLVIAPLDEQRVSRKHLELQLLGDSLVENSGSIASVLVQNCSKMRSIVVDAQHRLKPLASEQFELPVLLSMDPFVLRIESATKEVNDYRWLEQPTLAPMRTGEGPAALQPQPSLFATMQPGSVDPSKLEGWLSAMVDVLQNAACSQDYLEHSVQAVQSIVGFDSVIALKRSNDRWQIAANIAKDHTAGGAAFRMPSETILNLLLQQKRTIFRVPGKHRGAASLQDVVALVVAPILNPDGEVIGALYGSRQGQPNQREAQISEIEARMVEVVACSAAAGIAREEQQRRAVKMQTQFEQFFSPELARELAVNPGLLEPKDAVISALFCDIADFSSICHRIGPQSTMRWTSSVMNCLSQAVIDHEGVVVDYIGDELLAMWGAPKQTEDHATKALLAALAMMQCKKQLDLQWRSVIGQPTGLRIGIASGAATVGNTGSQHRMKYGPLGTTVNLASRLQTASKQLDATILLDAATASSAPPGLKSQLRPLGTARFVNIATPVAIFELSETPSVGFRRLADRFAQCVARLTKGDRSTVIDLLTDMQKEFPDDMPTQLLRHRLLELAQHRYEPPTECIWEFQTK